MSKRYRGHLHKHGLYSGWQEYRHPSSAKPVTLAPIFSAGRRDDLAARIAVLMEDWHTSPFEHEGPLQQRLRASLCLKGYEWARSNVEAKAVVDMAIDQLGLERPSWGEGQRDHVNGNDYCSWCSSPIDEEGRKPGQRFCCSECAKMALANREARSEGRQNLVLRSAERMIAREKAPARPCRACGKLFRSDVESAVLCSRECVGLDHRIREDFECQGCGRVTRTTNTGQRFCSLTCRSATVQKERRERLADVRFQCAECGTEFAPKTERARHCSDRCGSRERNRLYLARKGQAAEFTYICQCCGVGFTSNRPRAPFCGKECKDVVGRFEGGKGKRLTARMFDYMLHRDRVPMTGLHITDSLFA